MGLFEDIEKNRKPRKKENFLKEIAPAAVPFVLMVTGMVKSLWLILIMFIPIILEEISSNNK